MNCLITKTGKVVDCDSSGATHDVVCKLQLKISLATFLVKRGGVRVMRGYCDPETIAIEYHHKPTLEQAGVIRRILRNDDYYTVVLVKQVISRFRPIRTITF